MSKAKEIIKISLILFLITAISALLLAFVNEKTAPLIAENSEKKTQEALKGVMSAAEKFEMVDNEFNVEDCTIDRVYKAKDSSGKVVGVCTIIETKGYESGLKSAVGVDADGKVTGVEIISHKETPGLGANAEKEEFRSQYVGKPGKISVVKSNADKNEINAISGATMTSNGVTRSVNGAVEIAKKIIGGER